MSSELRGLKQVHLSRLSPVMWDVKHGYPRKAMTVPIATAGGMDGDDDDRYKSVPLDYQRQPVWNDLYRVGTLGAMSRVAPFGPAGFGGLGGPEDCTAEQVWNPMKEQCVDLCSGGRTWDPVRHKCMYPGDYYTTRRYCGSPVGGCPTGTTWNSTSCVCKPNCSMGYHWDPAISACRRGPGPGSSGFGTEPASSSDATKKWLFILLAIGAGAFLFNRFA